MSRCYDCNKEIDTDLFRCDDCFNQAVKIQKKQEKMRRALTEWEAMKLSWYRSEKKWHDNIQRRKIITENGHRITVLTDYKGNITQKMPSQPKHLKAKPQIFQPGYQSSSERIDR